MTVDMTDNRVPYGLLTDEEKAALHEHEKAGGKFLFTRGGQDWEPSSSPNWFYNISYRTVPLPKTQDVIAWDRLPEWVEWVARWSDHTVWGFKGEPAMGSVGWYRTKALRVDDFPGIVQIGTVDWKDSKQRRPKVRE